MPCSLIFVTILTTGCAGLVGESIGSGDKGRLLLSADAEGLKSFGQVLHGSKSKDSPYWPLQHEQELTKRARFKVNLPGAK